MRTQTTPQSGILCLFCCIASLFLCSAELQAGYCPSVTLISQQEIDDFPSTFGCDSIGSLNIAKPNLLRLDSLYSLVFVESLSITIGDINQLVIESFRGLHNLKYLGRCRINEAILKNQFKDFPNIDMEELEIKDTSFTSFAGLDSIERIDRIKVTNCNRISTLNGLLNLKEVEELILEGVNIPLISLPKLEKLKSVYIYDCVRFNRIYNIGNVTNLRSVTILNSGSRSNGVFRIDQDLGILGDGLKIENCSYREVKLPRINRISSIDFSANPNLDYVDIKGLMNDTIRKIRVNNVPKLKSFNFRENVNILQLDELVLDSDFDFSFTYNAEYLGKLEISHNTMTNWPYHQLNRINILLLESNFQLSDCCGLYNLIRSGRVGSYHILKNGVNCANYLDLYNYCGPSVDADEDGILDLDDNCPNDYNQSQADGDGDGIGDVCDNCPQLANADQLDVNNNKVGDACENAEYDTKLSIENGDALIDSPAGLILRGVDNQCYRIVVDGEGALRTKIVPCPQ